MAEEQERPPRSGTDSARPLTVGEFAYRAAVKSGARVSTDPEGVSLSLPGELVNPLLQHWLVIARLTEHEGSLAIAELHLVPDQAERADSPPDPPVWDRSSPVPDGGVTSTLLRFVRVGAILAWARVLAPTHLDRVDPEHADGLRDLVRPGGGAKRSGRRGNPDILYARVAGAYVHALAQGARRPIADIADDLGYSRNYTRDLVKESRRRGLLTSPAARGRAGGHLTERARELLAEHEGNIE